MLYFSMELMAPKLVGQGFRNDGCEMVSGHARIMVAAFCEPPCADVVAGAALCDLHVQISRQGQHFVNLHVQISWQVQHFVNLHVQISWQAQHLGSWKLRTGDFCSNCGARSVWRAGR